MQFGLFRFVFLAVSKSFSKLFGVATMSFFGRMPSRDDEQIAAAGLVSLWWIFLPPAIAFPKLAEYVIPFLPDDDGVVRVVAVVLTVLIPLGVGALVASVHNRRNDSRRWITVLAGYLYTPAMGLLVIALIVVVPLSKASYLFRRFELENFGLMIRSGDFDDAVEEVKAAMSRAGVELEEQQPRKVLGWVFRALTHVDERIFRRDLSKQMRLLRGEVDGKHLEITLHATDLSVVGPQSCVTYTIAVLSEELSPENIYYTWDDEAQELEDELLEVRRRIDDGDDVTHDELLELRDRLRTMELDPEEWNAVRRQLYALERDCFRARVEQPAA